LGLAPTGPEPVSTARAGTRAAPSHAGRGLETGIGSALDLGIIAPGHGARRSPTVTPFVRNTGCQRLFSRFSDRGPNDDITSC